MWTDNITRPTMILDAAQCRENIRGMVAKAQRNCVRLRAHSKTHQSVAVAAWLRDELCATASENGGTTAITGLTVSSVEMAAYFYHEGGWKDLTIAFTANPRQIPAMNALLAAGNVTLGLLVESVETVRLLQAGLQYDVRIWIDIDTGYHRTGLDWHAQRDDIRDVARAVRDGPHTTLVGLLGHAGHTYDNRGSLSTVQRIHDETVQRLTAVRDALQQDSDNSHSLLISLGDTPSCSMVTDFGTQVDEIRPGNFFFYDVMQANIGACTLSDIAVAVACPVVAKQRHLQQIVLYGGAVHLSKDRIVDAHGRTCFGRVARPTTTGWEILPDSSYVKSLSQEHGLVHADETLFDSVQVGDILLVLPIHSCLAANLLKRYQLLQDGSTVTMAPIPSIHE